MKKWIVVFGILCLLPAVAVAQWQSPTIVGGAGVGYGFSGPEIHRTFVYQFVGLHVKELTNGAVYLCFQRGFPQGTEVGGIGGKLLLVSQWRRLPDFTWSMGLGFLDNLQPLQDESPMKAGLTFDGGLSYDVNDWMDIGVYGSAWDRGGNADWFLSIFGSVKDPQRLLGLK